MADFTCMTTWSGTVHVSLAVNVSSRKPSIGTIQPKRRTNYYSQLDNPVLRRPVGPGKYTSFRFTQNPIDVGTDASIGTVGDALDNALAVTTIGLYKTELIKSGPWPHGKEVEKATAASADWYNDRGLQEVCGHRPPTGFETPHEQGDLSNLVA
ncbi:hypothetical protein [Amycolatopsis cihanbeyliensis]|uniref:hypothetical protein n=1 Tax=Amycolatopsis cihanbeyliensis TaxID=1128664 RepID=UPI001150AEDA|nr:hypothetical protein [Amycolatopsis cihanbeyliensis]